MNRIIVGRPVVPVDVDRRMHCDTGAPRYEPSGGFAASSSRSSCFTVRGIFGMSSTDLMSSGPRPADSSFFLKNGIGWLKIRWISARSRSSWSARS